MLYKKHCTFLYSFLRNPTLGIISFFDDAPCKSSYTIKVVVSVLLQHKQSIQFSWFISSIPLGASSSFPAQITCCNLHAPSRCSRWWMPAIRTRQLQIQKSTFITPDNHYVLFYKISFGADPVKRFGLGFNESAKMVFYCLMLHLVICLRLAWRLFALFLLLLGCRNTVSGLNPPSLWLRGAPCQTIIFCITNWRLSHCWWLTSLTECQGLAWTNGLFRTYAAPLDWNGIIFVYRIKGLFILCHGARVCTNPGE